MPKVNRTYKGNATTYIQSVRFDKTIWTEERAKQWCIKHDFYIDGFDNADNEYRFRQYDPQEEIYNYRALDGKVRGLYFIIAIKK